MGVGMKKTAFVLLVPAALLFAGCAHTIIPQVTPLQYDPATMELLGPVTGESTKKSYVFGMFEAPPAGDDFSTEAAIRDALAKVHGDALLNPVLDEDGSDYFGLYYVLTLRVSGLAVRFKDRPRRPLTVDDTPLPAEPTPTAVPTALPAGKAKARSAGPSSAPARKAGL